VSPLVDHRLIGARRPEWQEQQTLELCGPGRRPDEACSDTLLGHESIYHHNDLSDDVATRLPQLLSWVPRKKAKVVVLVEEAGVGAVLARRRSPTSGGARRRRR
jgi:hypothetical protein